MSELPHALLEEILCRVPAASLKRLRSTCKEWDRLFNDRRFSRKHFDKATKQFLVLTLTEKYRLCSLSVNLHNGIPSVEVTGEPSLIDHSNSNQVNIDKVSHCDGLLLCTIKKDTRIVVWNPCTGQTKWIQTGKSHSFHDFVLGYYQDKKSCDKSYKILSYKCYNCDDQEFEIYDIISNSWRKLDVTPIPDYRFMYFYYRVFLKGKTYWFAFDEKEEELGLISFDYTTERFNRLHLPYQCDRYKDLYLSVVGEEKITVLLQHENTSRKEIWVTTNKVDDETKEMSWTMVLEVEVNTGRDSWRGISLLGDEKKKVVLFCEKCLFHDHFIITVSIVGKDTQVDVRVMSSYWPFLVDYVPSLIQIQQPGGKRKEANNYNFFVI